MHTIDTLSDQDYTKLIIQVWNFLAVSEKPRGMYDAIFVFGCMDEAVPRYAATLWHAGYAKYILVSGASGTLNAGAKRTEAEIFHDILIQEGVEPTTIILEKTATNTLENVLLGTKALLRKGLRTQRLCIAAKPFIMRRCVATFHKCFPSVEVTPAPPPGKPLDFLDRSRQVYAERLVAELTRLQQYGDKGDIALVPIPKKVKLAAAIIEQHLSV